MRQRNRQISPERKGLFTFGTVLMAIGALVIVVGFIGFFTSSQDAVASFGKGSSNPVSWWIGVFVGMLVAGVGSAMRHLAARGVAGSGLVLDPDRARRDLEPWARMGGGMIKDAIEETGLPIGQGPAAPAAAAEPAIKVRCGKCRALNDETAKFCAQCAAPL